MSDYGCDLPVWGGVEDDELTTELRDDLRAWQKLFDDDHHWERGWRPGPAEARYAHLAPVLRDRVAHELGVDVEGDFWPVRDPALCAWSNGRPARPGGW